jgi:hypothetical protein
MSMSPAIAAWHTHHAVFWQVDTLLALHRLPQHEEAPQALLQHPGGFFNMGKIRIRPFITAIFLAVPLLGALFALSPVASAFAAGTSSVAGHVYVLDNATNGNAISAFNRAADGTLTSAGTTAIGGQGSGGGLGSQGSLIFSPDRSLLFAVDAGSNQISVVGVDAHGTLHPASVSSSGGVDPISLTSTGHFLYVVSTVAQICRQTWTSVVRAALIQSSVPSVPATFQGAIGSGHVRESMQAGTYSLWTSN